MKYTVYSKNIMKKSSVFFIKRANTTVTPKNSKLFFLLALPLSIYTNSSYAECTRVDIDHYLDKGFTPEQITTMCTTPTVNNTDKAVNKKLSAEKITATGSDEIYSLKKNERFLKEAIKGRNVLLTDNSLQYTLKVCIEYGDEDMYGFAPKACPKVRYTIARKGLEVIKSQKKYIFFGSDEIKVKSTIRREIVGDLEKNTIEEQQLIQQLLESGDHTVIPIRDDISLDSVEQVLLQVSF